MKNAKASDVESVTTITSELDGAKDSLQKVLEEESALWSSLDSLMLELENLREKHAELKDEAVEKDSFSGNLHVKLRMSKSKLEVIAAMHATFSLEDAEKELKIALEEAEEAKAAEARALDQIKTLSERTHAV
ncbi:hypothetical protein Nepgr_027325 [Nepenthes gracilis]|uniref:Uncharacterized protein n=1 Tax=Nepenthes gracilis TaxID=150966 RepID=A0AAD3Y151_NEPGR|nr:hypothetical protein Nepgr_027325 [Nepenthes gracilis]